jgi:hypothetical protein
MAGQIILTNSGTTPPTPASGSVTIFTRTSDKQLYSVDDTGAVAGPFGFTLASASDVSTGTSTTTVMTPSSFRLGGLVSATPQATTSGTSIDFTGIPSWVKRITIMLDGVSSSGTSVHLIQLGDSGGIENTGYSSVGSNIAGSSAATVFTTGFGLQQTIAAAGIYRGALTLSLLDGSNNTWVCSGNLARTDTAGINSSAGSKSLSSTLTQLRLTTVNGTDTFDAGVINIIYE